MWKYALALQCLSVCLHRTVQTPLNKFSWKFVLRCHTETLLTESHENFVGGLHFGLWSGNMIGPFTWKSTHTSALISSISLNIYLQAKSFYNRMFSKDEVQILCAVHFFHKPHSLWDNKTKERKYATNFSQCLHFLTCFLPCVTSSQLSLNILFTSLFRNTRNWRKVIGLQYNLNIKGSIIYVIFKFKWEIQYTCVIYGYKIRLSVLIQIC